MEGLLKHAIPARIRPARKRDAPWSLGPKTAVPGDAGVVAGRRYYSPGLGRWASRDPIGERGGVLLYGFACNSPVCYVDPVGNLFMGTVAVLAGGVYLLGNLTTIVYESIVLPVKEWSLNEAYCSAIKCWAGKKGIDLLDLSKAPPPAQKVGFCSYWRECMDKNKTVKTVTSITIAATSFPGVAPGGSPVTSEADIIAALITKAVSEAGVTEEDVVDASKIVISGNKASMAVTVRTNEALQGLCKD